VEDGVHPVEHRAKPVAGDDEFARAVREPRSLRRVVQQRIDPCRERVGVLDGDHPRSLAVARNLRDRARGRGDAGHAGEHRLQERLRDAFVRVRRQHEEVECREPRCDVIPLSGEYHALAQSELAGLRFDRGALRAVADDREPRVAMPQPRQRVDQEAVTLPASQRCDNADQRDVLGQRQLAACRGAIALAETGSPRCR
jgi:hypothetical protein